MSKKTEAAGTSWRDVASWLWEFFGPAIKPLIGPLVASAAVYVIAGKEFVQSSHTVSGWVLVGFAGVAGLCVVSVSLHVYQWWRRRLRSGILAIVHIGPRALWWQMGKQGEASMMMPWGDFHVTNRTPRTVAVPRTVLDVSYKRWGIIPARRRIDGFGLFEPLKGGHARQDRFFWIIEPPILNEGEVLHARICLVDHLGGENWTGWLRWPYIGDA